MYGLNHTRGCLQISGQLPKQGVNLRYRPFHSGYHALLGRTVFARFNAVPHYAYLKLKMPGPRGVITVNGNTERSLRTEEHTADLAVEVQSGLLKQNLNSAAEHTDTVKRVRTTLQQDNSGSSGARLAIWPPSQS